MYVEKKKMSKYSNGVGIILGATVFTWTIIMIHLFTYPHFPTGSECYKRSNGECMDMCGCMLCNYTTSEICVSEKETFLCNQHVSLSPDCKKLQYSFDATLVTIFVLSIFIVSLTLLYMKEKNRETEKSIF
jgi:hypothetical protein